MFSAKKITRTSYYSKAYMQGDRYYKDFFKTPVLPVTKAPTGFGSHCIGCPHILENSKGKYCVFVYTPAQSKVPCFFKNNVPAGGWDGVYGRSVNNYIKKLIPQDNAESDKEDKIGEE